MAEAQEDNKSAGKLQDSRRKVPAAVFTLTKAEIAKDLEIIKNTVNYHLAVPAQKIIKLETPVHIASTRTMRPRSANRKRSWNDVYDWTQEYEPRSKRVAKDIVGAELLLGFCTSSQSDEDTSEGFHLRSKTDSPGLVSRVPVEAKPRTTRATVIKEEVERPVRAVKRATRRTAALPAPAQCAECGTPVTPQWRNGPSGPKSLCNACGIQLHRNLNRPKPQKLSSRPASPIGLQCQTIAE